jgi:hypothetical protein
MTWQDRRSAALCTKPGGGELLNADEPQRLRRIDDGDAGMTTERQQMLAITGDDQVGLRGHGGGDDLIVVNIAGHDPRPGGGCDQFYNLDVIGEYRGCRLTDEREALGGGWPGEYVGQFFEQRGAAVALRA